MSNVTGLFIGLGQSVSWPVLQAFLLSSVGSLLILVLLLASSHPQIAAGGTNRRCLLFTTQKSYFHKTIRLHRTCHHQSSRPVCIFSPIVANRGASPFHQPEKKSGCNASTSSASLMVASAAQYKGYRQSKQTFSTSL